MEPISTPILSFEAFAKGDDGSVAPFDLKVYTPGYEAGKGYYCFASCPYLSQKPYQIFGVDPEQACELVIDFIRMRLRGSAELIDMDGKPISLPGIVWSETPTE